MDSTWLTPNPLPEIFGLVIVIGCFRPLVRRAGPHVNLWFVAWSFLLLHFVLLTLQPHASHANAWLQWGGNGCFSLALLLFAFTAENDPARRVQWPLVAMLALPLLCEDAVNAFAVHPSFLDRLPSLLYLTPVLYMGLSIGRNGKRGRVAPARQPKILSGVSLTLAILALAANPRHALLVGHAQTTLLLLSAAYLFGCSAYRMHRAAIAAIAGMACWALTWPLLAVLDRLAHPLRVSATILELPIYLMAGGVILTLLEEHIHATERLAMHDPLTDLANRRMFELRLARALEEAHTEFKTIACLVIDVDNFKTINDTLGHDAGDQVLKALSVRLGWHIGPRDLLARTGGDEFTALLAGVHNEHHLAFVAGAMMSAASVPILVDDKPVEVRISIGIALSPDHADDTESLRRAADHAMYSAKRRGGSILAFAGDD